MYAWRVYISTRRSAGINGIASDSNYATNLTLSTKKSKRLWKTAENSQLFHSNALDVHSFPVRTPLCCQARWRLASFGPLTSRFQLNCKLSLQLKLRAKPTTNFPILRHARMKVSWRMKWCQWNLSIEFLRSSCVSKVIEISNNRWRYE